MFHSAIDAAPISLETIIPLFIACVNRVDHYKPPFTLQRKNSQAGMKIGKGNFHFLQGKGKMCSVKGENLSCLANLFFGFRTGYKKTIKEQITLRTDCLKTENKTKLI